MSLTQPQTDFVNHIVSGLRRRSISTCSQWAMKYRRVGAPFPGPFTFKYHPWQREMHDSLAPVNVGQKAAQVGYTDTVLNIVFYSLDILGKDVLYVLPTSSDASDFTAGRFNPALELSPHLSSLFSDVSNVGHKRAGTRNLYVRGSRSRSKLKSVPVSRLILDEVDEMTQNNIPLVEERLSGQMETLQWMISTPTVPDAGINQFFNGSTQNHFHFRCPSCSRFIELTFPDNLVVTGDSPDDPRLADSHLICNQCHASLPHNTKHVWLQTGRWAPTYRDRLTEGWYINQLYSSAEKASPFNIARLYLRSLSDPAEAQEFHNSKLGLPYEVAGSRLTDTIIDSCIGNYLSGRTTTNKLTTMGVDQGRWLHYEVAEWDITISNDLSVTSFATIREVDTVREFEHLDELMIRYSMNFCVIDSQPERRKANEFARRFPGRVRLCFYPEGMNTKQITLSDAGDEPLVSVDRTSWLDTALGRFHNRTISLPINTNYDYKQHLQAITRIYKKDKNGNPIGRYVTGSRPDHFAHARNYNEIAMHLAAGVSQSKTISSY